jgi:hypothetical protein
VISRRALIGASAAMAGARLAQAGPLGLALPRNVFAFPAGQAPGYDQNHIAASPMMRASAVATPSGMLSLFRGRATCSGAYIPRITSAGPGLLFYNGMSPYPYVDIAGLPSETPTALTFAAIYTPYQSAAYSKVVQNGTTSGNSLMVGALAPAFNCASGNYYATAVALSINVPYFLGLSATASNIYFVSTNLLTGQIKSSTFSGTYTFTATGSNICQFGNQTTGNSSYTANGTIHAGMFAASALSLQQLLAWAADPWSFWYPRRSRFLQ